MHGKNKCFYFFIYSFFSFILTVCIYLNDHNYQSSKRDTLTYEIQLDKDKEQVDKRLLFRESYRSFKKRQIRLSNRVCHDYSLYMKVC